MVNNSTNINKNHLNSLSDGQQFHQYQQKTPLTSTHWVMVNNSPISTTIISHFNSLSDGQQFHQYQQKSPLISIHWVMVNNFTNINKNHLSPQLIEWWSTIPPISTKITSHLNSLSDGKQFHQYQQKSPLTSTHWVMSTITPISTKITSHFNSLNDGQQFHQYQQKSPLKNHLSLNSLNDGQQFHQYQQKSPKLIEWWSNSTNINKNHLTSTHWWCNNSTNINKNHISLTIQLIEWCQ